ncbi:MAG: type II toxin-antitoxin system Phd/YefM family antitoxin [Planctomycetota bacterium]
MRLNSEELIENFEHWCDHVLLSGCSIEIEHRGHTLRLEPVIEPGLSKLDRLVSRPDFFRVDPDEIIHIDWMAEGD